MNTAGPPGQQRGPGGGAAPRSRPGTSPARSAGSASPASWASSSRAGQFVAWRQLAAQGVFLSSHPAQLVLLHADRRPPRPPRGRAGLVRGRLLRACAAWPTRRGEDGLRPASPPTGTSSARCGCTCFCCCLSSRKELRCTRRDGARSALGRRRRALRRQLAEDDDVDLHRHRRPAVLRACSAATPSCGIRSRRPGRGSPRSSASRSSRS